MNLIHLDTKHQVYWLSYDYLLKHDVSEDAIGQWRKRNICRRKYIDGRAFINYDTIPEPTREKLPNKETLKAEYNRQRHSYLENKYTEELKEAYKSKEVIKWINTIRDTEAYKGIDRTKITEFARHTSVLEKAVYLYNNTTRQGALIALFHAYKSIYPDRYSMKNRFCMALKRVNEEGVLSVAIDKRAIQPPKNLKYTALHHYLVEVTTGHNKAFDIVDAYEMFCSACKELNEQTPSWWWFQDYYYKHKNQIEPNRLGQSIYEKEYANRARIIPALYANDQWQMDGWRIPIYCKKRNEKGGLEYYVTYNLFAVLDAHSRRIIGFDISESENTENILKGLERAVKTTGVLPYELVADNHSFNKTKEADYLKAETDRLGMKWTIDSNPRRKAILERAFRTLGDKHFKKHYGYIGQGVKSKIKNGITQQELSDIYQRPENFLTYDQIVVLTTCIIEEYNNRLKKGIGQSPAERYAKSEQPSCIQIDEFTRMSLFNRRTEHKVSHGQIVIRRGQHIYEYQLPAEYSARHNNKSVSVRYADFDEIYLYDLETNEPICCVAQKMSIHGALANQSDLDIDNLLKNKGRIKGIESKGRKRKESIFDAANTINPNAYDAVNKITTPKDVIAEARQNKNVRAMLTEQGVTLETITPLPKVDEMLDNSLKPRKKEVKHPFAVKTEIRKIRI